MRLGIDSGGTFTDFVFLGAGEGRVHKVPSTPADPLQAILAGVAELLPQGLDGVEVVHGTTRGTNAFLERQGARVVPETCCQFSVFLDGDDPPSPLQQLAGQGPLAGADLEDSVFFAGTDGVSDPAKDSGIG